MPYARQNWTINEVQRLTQNPVSAQGAPHAHSGIHATQNELASHPMFHRARATNRVVQTDRRGRIRESNEVGAHSTMGNQQLSQALLRALNHDRMQPHLQRLDQQGGDLKLWVNFIAPIGRGTLHRSTGSAQIDIRCLFVYMKSNPGNQDLPIFQTLVPHGNHKPIGSVTDPVIIVA